MPKERLADGDATTVGELLAARLQSFSTVRAAGYTESFPIVSLARGGRVRTTLAVPDEPAPWPSPEQPDTRIVSRDFLTAMGTNLVAGRGFNDRDSAGQPQVMLINQTMARSGFFGAVLSGNTPISTSV